MGLGIQGNLAQVEQYKKTNDAALKADAKALKLLYYAMGTDDFLYGAAAPTLAMFERAGITAHYNETGGGHTWINWRRYLADFLPRLFK